MKVVSTDHKQANNLTSLIICYFKQMDIFRIIFVIDSHVHETVPHGPKHYIVGDLFY